LTPSGAKQAGLDLVLAEAKNQEEVTSAFGTLIHASVQAVIIPSDPFFFTQRYRIAELSIRHKLPAIFADRDYVEAGGLMSYGESLSYFYRRAAGYVHRILKGEKPADLPVQNPTKYELVINLKTAKTLGLDVPATLLARADEVIE
jgi:putative tryptophan/tyrosine transport system substrate-binding protein